MEELVRQARGQQVVSRSSVAAFTFIVYDILITLGEEVDLVWSKPHASWAKWLYLFVRYIPLIFEIGTMFSTTQVLPKPLIYSKQQCTSWFIFQEVGMQVVISAVEVMLIVRVRALYLKNERITKILAVLFVAEVITMILILVFLAGTVEMDEHCVVISTPPLFMVFAGVFVGYELLLFILTLVKFVEAYRNGWNRMPLLTLVVRDGTWAFLVIFAAISVNVGFFFGIKGQGSSAGIDWLLSLESFAGCHLMLQMDSFAAAISTDPASPNGKRRRTLSRSRRRTTAGTNVTVTGNEAFTGNGTQFTSIFLATDDFLPESETDSSGATRDGGGVGLNLVFNPGSEVTFDEGGDRNGEEYSESVPVSVVQIGEREFEEVEMEVIRHRRGDLESGRSPENQVVSLN